MVEKIKLSNKNNKLLVDNFIKLIKYIEYKFGHVDHFTYKIRIFKNALRIIKNHPDKIKSGNDLKDVRGIGKGIMSRIDEILKTKTLKELKGFNENYKERKETIINELQKVINIGEKKAIELVKKYDIKSINDLKKKHKKGEIKLNDKILIGLKYYGKVQENIPRKEIDKFYKKIIKVGKEIDKDLIVKIAGSYRRENKISNDIDILLSHKKIKTNKELNKNYLNLFIKNLKNKKMIIDDLTTDTSNTKYMGFSKLNDNHIRRIDIRFVPFQSYHSALLYFTGSFQLNRQMRQIAKKLGYKLNEYGLYKNNKLIKVKSEKDIFDKLKLDFKKPKFR